MSNGIPKMVPKKPPIPSGRALQYAFSEKNRNGEITFFLNYFARIYCKEHFLSHRQIHGLWTHDG